MQLQNQDRDKIKNIDVLKTSDHIKIKIKMPTHTPQSGTSSVLQSFEKGIKDMDVIRTYKIKIEPKFGTLVYQMPVTISKSR